MEYVNSIIETQLKSDVDVLKYKAIQKYFGLLSHLERGHRIDYQEILELISLIDIYSELDHKKIYYKGLYIGYSPIYPRLEGNPSLGEEYDPSISSNSVIRYKNF